MDKITVKSIQVNITGISDDDFISLTDMAKIKNPEFPADVIKNWMRLRTTIEYLGIWEQINNGSNEMEKDYQRNWIQNQIRQVWRRHVRSPRHRP